MLTHIQTRIERDVFVATCPHVPHLKGVHWDESRAVTRLIVQVHDHRRQYEARRQPVPWIARPVFPTGPDIQTRRISGLWPAEIVEPETAATPADAVVSD